MRSDMGTENSFILHYRIYFLEMNAIDLSMEKAHSTLELNHGGVF